MDKSNISFWKDFGDEVLSSGWMHEETVQCVVKAMLGLNIALLDLYDVYKKRRYSNVF